MYANKKKSGGRSDWEKERRIMIFDTKENLAAYKGLGKNYEKAIDFLMNSDLEHMEVGKYEIDGKEVYASVQEYTTLPWEEAKFETHENYTDIQYIIKGDEIMGYAPKASLKVKVEYNPEKDVTFYTNDVRGLDVPAHDGMFCIFQPQDGHKPKAMHQKPCAVKKVVVKIKEK